MSGCRHISDCRSRGAISIPVQSQTFVEIGRVIISTAILPSSADSRRVVVSYKRSMCTKYWLTAKSSLPRIKGVVR